MTYPIRVLICGTGGGAHVLAGLFSTQPDVDVRVFTQNTDKIRRWREAMRRNEMLTVTVRRNGHGSLVALKAQPFTVTDEPEQARGCDFIIFAVPAFMHWTYLSALQPYIEDGCVIVGLPGQNGFEFDVRKALGERVENCVVMNFESLPWICRLAEFSRAVGIFGIKDKLVGALEGDLTRARVADPLATLQRLLGETPKLAVSGHLLGITLRSPNAYSHPPIMYGRWKDWDGVALERSPLFYQGVDEDTAELLGKVSEEVVRVSRRIMSEHPPLDLTQVIPMYDWDITCYGKDIKDKTNLMTALRTNSGYKGITHPMTRTANGKYVPDFNHRFLAEDVPFGLVVIRGIAEIARVQTPCLDKVLRWCQERLGKEYLVGSRLVGKDLATTRCPQRYGLTTIGEVLGAEWVRQPALAR
ncbi:MAG TPA: NAD/NADP octopine/nopaline dehydrogenase family protein [Pyrinomonadaceae bacterium]|nr:NAD/NADP octopine/nopaline dehydrogenase family protein [Pyrinomonadaceae bacterium]